MPVAASLVSKKTFIAREVTPGVRAAPNLWLHGLNIRVVGDSTRGEVRPSGSTMRTARPLIQNWSTFTIAAGSYLDYNSLLYPLASMLGVPVTTTPGGGSLSREHAFTYASDGSNVRPAFSFATGYTGGTAEETLRNIFQAFNFGLSRSAAPTIGGNGYGRILDMSATVAPAVVINTTVQGNANSNTNEQQTVTIPTPTPTGGTYTLTFGAGTSTNIPFNATNAALTNILVNINTIGSGNASSAGSPGGPWTVSFISGLGNTNVAQMTANPAGLTGQITTVPVKAIQAPEWDVYMDSAVGSIGTTRIRPYSVAFAFSGLTNPDWVIDSTTTSYDDDVLQVPTLTMNIVLRNDATSRALYAALINGATYYVRLDAIGPVIEGALHYEFRLDAAVQADANLGQFGDEGGSETIPLPLTIVSDSTFANGGFSALLRNVLTTI